MKNKILIEEMKKHILFCHEVWVKCACEGVDATEKAQENAIKTMENNLDILIGMVKESSE